ncbi:MAG: hypothetical protein KAQ94_07995 [Arcobacteraceae bacterium]|nr:hypothetical protein [Arcobacteraceae bacterium]
MKKILFLIFIFISTLNANELLNKIENLMGKEQFNLHNNLIHILFRTQEKFYITDNRLNYKLILETLKENGLLHLKFKKPKQINIEFTTNNDPIKSLKILNDTLRDMGYSYYFTKSNVFDKETNIMRWTIVFNTEYALDPLILTQELKLRSCNILDIQKVTNTLWRYNIDVNHANITDAIKIDHNEKIIMEKPLKPYFIKVTDATSLQVISRKLNHWFPYIAFYDNHLNVLKVIKKDRVYKGYKTKVPRETKYIKITDLYTLINIKRGLSIIVR